MVEPLASHPLRLWMCASPLPDGRRNILRRLHVSDGRELRLESAEEGVDMTVAKCRCDEAPVRIEDLVGLLTSSGLTQSDNPVVLEEHRVSRVNRSIGESMARPDGGVIDPDPCHQHSSSRRGGRPNASRPSIDYFLKLVHTWS